MCDVTVLFEEYEHHVADVLREEGWTARVTPMSGDWGLDIVAERQGRRLGVQVKRYGGSTRRVNREEIMCLRGAADYQDCHESMLITDGRVWPDAQTVATKLGITIRHVPAGASPPTLAAPLLSIADVAPSSKSQTFGGIWAEEIHALEGQRLIRSNGKSNRILRVDNGGVTRETSGGTRQRIRIETFRWAIERLLCGEVVTRSEIDARDPRRVSSGVMLILASVPSFEASTLGSAQAVRLSGRPSRYPIDERVDATQCGPRAGTTTPTASETPPPEENIDALLAKLDVLGPPTGWEPAAEYDSLALALLDAVWSIGVRYGGVLNVLARYRSLRRAAGHDAEHDIPGQLAHYIDDVGGPAGFADIVGNRQRTSSRSGILKADAVYRQATMLASEGINTPVQLSAAVPDHRDHIRANWIAVPGQGSGLSWNYFLMLARLPGVKADRMIRRFVATAIGRTHEHAVSPDEASTLVTAAADRLGIEDRTLDYAIWRYQSALS